MKAWIICVLAIVAIGRGVGAQSVEVPRGYDGAPFRYDINQVEAQPLYSIYRITYDVPAPEPGVNPEGVAYYYLPAGITPGAAPRPGVICLHILGGDGGLTRTIATYLAQQGLPAMMVIMPWFGERAAATGGRSKMTGSVLAGALNQTPADVRRAIDILQSRPEINPDRIELLGTSMGAIFGATVTGMDERIKRAAFLLGGGDLPAILAQPTPEATPIRLALAAAPANEQERIAAILRDIDPLTRADALRERARSGNILMMNAAQDEVIPPALSRRLAEAIELPPSQHIWFPEVGHYTAISQLPDLLARLAQFLTDDTVKTPAAQPKENLTAVVLGRMAEMLLMQPGLKLKLSVDGTLADGKACRGTVEFRRGAEGRFLFDAALTESPVPLQRLTLGNDGKVWLGGIGSQVYRGNLSNEGAAPVFPQLPPKLPQYLTLASGLFRMAAANPTVLRQYLTITEKRDGDGKEYLELFAPKEQITVRIYPDASGKRPGELTVASREFNGDIRVDEWELHAESAGAVFAPPPERELVEVEAYDLHRLLNQTITFFTGKK